MHRVQQQPDIPLDYVESLLPETGSNLIRYKWHPGREKKVNFLSETLRNLGVPTVLFLDKLIQCSNLQINSRGKYTEN